MVKLTHENNLKDFTIDNVVNSLRDKKNISAIKCYMDIVAHLTRKGVFSFGNRKLKNTIAIFNLLPIATCPFCEECKNTCYAIKAVKMYPTCFDKRMMLTFMAKYYLPILENMIKENLYKIVNNKRSKVRFVRIHESGDFFSQEYVNLWTRIIAMFPSLRFYFYTKTNEIFDFSKMLALPNVNMVKSVLPNGMINFGDMDYLDYVKSLFPKMPICKYGFKDKNGNKITPICGECTLCMHNEHVLFLEH